MRGFLAAFYTEGLKAGKSKMLFATVLFFIFIDIMMGLLIYIAKHPELPGISALMGAKASAIGAADWPAYYVLLTEIVLMIGVIGFGMVASWVFGREYTDRTAKDLLALPVSRTAVVVSKTMVVIIWSALLSLVLFGVGLLIGKAVNLPGWSGAGARHAFTGFIISALLTMLLTTPVAFIASVSRGYLLPLGFVILMVIMTNLMFSGIPGLAPFFPWAVPALSSNALGHDLPRAGAASYFILGFTSLAGLSGTVLWLRFADQT